MKKLKVLNQFKDKTVGLRRVNEEFTATNERAEELVVGKWVEILGDATETKEDKSEKQTKEDKTAKQTK